VTWTVRVPDLGGREALIAESPGVCSSTADFPD
jgi:hypothetical protein